MKSLQLEESLVLLYLVVMHLRVIMHNIYNAVVCCAVLCCAVVCCSVLCCAAVSKVNKSESCTMAGPVWGNEKEGGKRDEWESGNFLQTRDLLLDLSLPKDFDSLLPR